MREGGNRESDSDGNALDGRDPGGVTATPGARRAHCIPDEKLLLGPDGQRQICGGSKPQVKKATTSPYGALTSQRERSPDSKPSENICGSIGSASKSIVTALLDSSNSGIKPSGST